MASTIKPGKIILETVLFVFKNRYLLLKALCIPFLLYMALDFVSLLNHPMWVTIFLSIIGLVLETWFAVTTHRLVLLGSDSVPTWGLRKITGREVVFFLHVLVFFGTLAALVYAQGPASTQVMAGILKLLGPELFLENYYVYMIPIAIIWLVLVCVSMLATIRLTLVFPGIAIDQGVSFALSWKLSKKHQIPLFFTLIVFPLLLGMAQLLVQTIPGATVVVSLLDALMNVFIVVALSISYREICKIEYGSLE